MGHEVSTMGHELSLMGHEVSTMGHELSLMGHEVSTMGHELSLMGHESTGGSAGAEMTASWVDAYYL
jgi:hypothetical protein